MPRQLRLINPSTFSFPVGSPPGTPVGPPPGWSPEGIVDLSLSPPPRSPVVRRQRRPITCSGCRQQGHNIRSCLFVDHGRDDIVRRDHLLQDILVRITRRVPEILTYPDVYERASTDIYLYILSLTRHDVHQGFMPGSFVINHCYTLIANNLNTIYPNVPHAPAPAVQHILRGKDYAKTIDVELIEETEEKNECFICCDKKCSVKTGCGHEYCSDCVISIIETNKNKTCAPRCSFCCAKFSAFTSSNPISHAHLVDFINNLI
jgi:hypothetical protein